jgi:hypothetical protein
VMLTTTPERLDENLNKKSWSGLVITSLCTN